MFDLFPQKWLLIGCAVSTIALPLQAADSQRYIEEIVVVAQKREQNVQDVPIAISAFSSQFLDNAGINDVLELQTFVPGLIVGTSQSVAQTTFIIRGVGTAGNSLSLESSVGLYVDGVYRSRQSSGINDLIDIERVEVLKGPQGTLFGKNTSSGAVQFLTVAPNPEEFEGHFEANAGNLDLLNFNGAVNLPLANGKAALRFSGGWTQRDGYVDNIATGSEVNNRDRYSVRGQLLLEPTDAVSIRMIADYSELDEKCCSAVNIFDGPGDTIDAFLAAGGIPFLAAPPGASYRVSVEHLGGDVALAKRFDKDEIAVDIDPSAKVEDSGLSVEVNWEFGNKMKLTSITAVRSYKVSDSIDADFTSLNTLSSSGTQTDQDTFTQEVRLTGSSDTFEYVAGVYYFDQKLDNQSRLRIGDDGNSIFTGGATLGLLDAIGAFSEFGIPAGAICAGLLGPELIPLCPLPAFPPGEGSDNISTQDQTSWAVFAQTDINITDSLVGTIGLRYLEESKDMDVTFTETIPTPIYALFTPLSPLVPDVTGEEFDDDEVTGTAKLSYFWNGDIMTYVSYGRGYKSGGTNIDRISPTTGAPLIFQPETSDSWEIGIKADLLSQRLRVNAAIYRTDYDDFQANTFVGTGFVLQNAGKITTTGGELEIFAVPNEWLTLSSGIAWVDAEYDKFEGGACIRTPLTNSPDAGQPSFPSVCDNSGNIVPSTPRVSFYASAAVTKYFSNGRMGYSQLDVSWRDEVEAGNDNDPNKTQDSLALINLRVGLSFNEKYDVSVWGKNLTDENYRTGSFNSVLREGSLSGFHSEPRTWGITLRAFY